MENYTEGLPLTSAELDQMITNAEDVTAMNTCKIIDMNNLFLIQILFNHLKIVYTQSYLQFALICKF